MIRFKKIVILCCTMLCGIAIISFATKQRFYICNEKTPIQQIKISKIFSTAGITGEENIETVILQDKKEIDAIVSKLKRNTFRKKISLEKITGVPTTTEDITQFFIDILHDEKEGQKHFDRISITCTEHMTWRNIEIICGDIKRKRKNIK